MADGFQVIEGGRGRKKDDDQDQLFLFDDENNDFAIPDWLNPAEDDGNQEEQKDEAIEFVEAEPVPQNLAEELDDEEPQTLSITERRWAWLEIDLKAIRHNLKAIRSRIGPSVKLLAVVKANAYGHGAVEVSRIALASGASFLGVSNVDEGVELRDAGIDAPILILSEPPMSAIPLILKHNLIPAVHTSGFVLTLGEIADKNNKIARYHLKIDTGMNRVGVRFNEAVEFLRTVSFHRGIELQGVFTHFATADAADSFETKKQLDRFVRAVESIRRAGFDPGIVHAANSAATIRYKKTHFDMVRVGLAMYGLHPGDTTKGRFDLKPAMSVKARVSAVKSVLVGEGVSYGLTYRSPGNVQIATLPIGYADGLSRGLSNRTDILVKGRACPQVGNICMDMCMFEVNQRMLLKEPRLSVEIGDEVTIVGQDANHAVTLDDMAKKLGTINYELACRFGMRLERTFIS